MSKSLIADFIVTIHLGFVLFIVLGLFIILLGGALRWRFIRNFWFRVIHLAMILIVVFETVLGISCPLTVWEYELRVAAGQQDATDISFVTRLIHQLIFFEFPQIVFTVSYCLFGMAIVMAWWFIPPFLPRKRK